MKYLFSLLILMGLAGVYVLAFAQLKPAPELPSIFRMVREQHDKAYGDTRIWESVIDRSCWLTSPEGRFSVRVEWCR